MNKKIFFFIIFFLAVFVKRSYAVEKITTIGLSVIPPRLSFDAAPGKVSTKEIKIRNESSIARNIMVSVKDFIVVDNEGTPRQIDSSQSEQSNRWSASQWIQPSQSKITLKSGEMKNILISILPPENASVGGHYAMVLFTPKKDENATNEGSSISTNVGSLIYITIPGDIKESAKISSFKPKSLFSEYGPITLNTIVNNQSDVHITPKGTITVKNIFGIKESTINLEASNIFPYTERKIDSIFEKKWLFGPFFANLTANYGTKNQLISANTVFWVIPWKIIVLTLVVVAIIVAITLLISRKNQPKINNSDNSSLNLKDKYKD